MSTPMEVATTSLQQANESLKRAEEEFRNWRTVNHSDFTSVGYLALSAEVTRCTAVLAGAQQTLQHALSAQNKILSPKSSTTSISYKSQSIYNEEQGNQELSPVTSERPVTPEDEKHFEMLKKYVYKTKNGSCVTILDEETAVTYAHGSHGLWKLGDSFEIFSILPNKPPLYVSVNEIHPDQDYILLKSGMKLCDHRLKLSSPYKNDKYIQIGLSTKDESPVVHHGVISSVEFDKYKGFYLGNTGSAPGVSGGGVFSAYSLELYGIAALTRKVPYGKSAETQLELINLNASYPHLSYICPPIRFKVKPPIFERMREYEEGDCRFYD